MSPEQFQVRAGVANDVQKLAEIEREAARQSTGLGDLILAHLLKQLVDSGVERCLLDVPCSNEVACALYRKAGFVDDGVRKDYYPTNNGREDALLMSCQLVNKV